MKYRIGFVSVIAISFLILVCLPGEYALAESEEAPSKAPPAEKTIDIDGVKLVMVEIPAGEFLMGSTFPGNIKHEYPQHKVIISKPFYLGKYEVTQMQWTKVMGNNPSFFKRKRTEGPRPVEDVSWNDAQEFITKLNGMTGQKFRLPTEAEWEYACRAGSTTKYFFGDDMEGLEEYAWYMDNSNYRSHPSGLKKPNPFGLYDILGNVWEWCSDRYGSKYYSASPETDPKGPNSGKYHIVRGGGWHWPGMGLRSAHRYYHESTHKYANIGLRLAMDKE